jgi:hypothetical protein
VAEFLYHVLDQLRAVEVAGGRAAPWRNVVVAGEREPVATHVDRLFGHVKEERMRCSQCHLLSVKFVREFVVELPCPVDVGVEQILSDLCLAWGRREEDVEKNCDRCGRNRPHSRQLKVVSQPNVLLLRVGRSRQDTKNLGEVNIVQRFRVLVDEELSLMGLGRMELLSATIGGGRRTAGIIRVLHAAQICSSGILMTCVE